MKKILEKCIINLETAKDAVSGDNMKAELAVKYLEEASEIIKEFDDIPREEKKQYFDELLKIQALGKLIQHALGKNKAMLQKKIIDNNKRNIAIKGYSSKM